MADAAPAQAPATSATPASAAQTPATAAPPAQAAPTSAQAPAAAQTAAAIPPALAAILGPPAAAQAPATATTPAAQTAAAQEPPKPATQEPTKGKSAEEQVAELRAQLTSQQVRSFVVGIAAEVGAHNPEQVHKLIADELDAAPDGRVFVKSDPRADAKQHIAKYLAGNLHMLKPAVPGGGAGSPATAQAAQTAQALDVTTAQGGTQNIRSFLGSIFPAPAANGASPR